MKQKIIFPVYGTENASTEMVELTCVCPICGVSLVPEVVSAILFQNIDEDNDNSDEHEGKAFLINYCARCDECFISRHVCDNEENVYSFHSSAPITSVKQNFSEYIQNLSPDFVTIYNESLLAEKSGLLSICGMGYRKALEFLIKDYAISLHPQEREKISKASLSNCIQTYINDKYLTALAQASTWIGNDETHYVKKNPDYGVKEQKIFINAFVTFIDATLAYLQAVDLTSIARDKLGSNLPI